MPETHSNTGTKSKWRLFFGVFLVVFGLVAVFNGVSSLFDRTKLLSAPNGRVTVEVMDTSELRSRGLSGRESLDNSKGMLFVFDYVSAEHCFWMKDMKFSIDMVWLDAEKHVVTVRPGVAPESYPDKFCPDLQAKYGLELASGRAEVLKITPDAKLIW